MIRNSHTAHLADAPEYGVPFNARHADQVARATNSILTEMCTALGVSDFNDLDSSNINKRTVTRDRLCEWLATLCFTLNRFASAHLQMAVERIDELNTSRISDQQKVIDLQNKLIEKREEELSSLKETVHNEVKLVQSMVQTEMKSYSSALTKSCSAALAPKKIHAAVKSVTEKESRAKNIIIYGAVEDNKEVLANKVSEILLEIDEKPVVKDCCRVGTKRDNLPRPVKFTLSSTDIVSQVLKKSRLLRSKEGYKSVYICPDRTDNERKAYKKLVEERNKKRDTEPDKVHFIRNNKVISCDKDTVPA